MNSLTLVILALCAFALGYRYYSAFMAARVAVLDDSRPTPAHRLEDGRDYVPTNRWVLFGHHFAAISGAGPLLGPVLAAQFGVLPGAIWIIIGAVMAGAVHDFVILFASVRHQGRSLSHIARETIGRRAGYAASVAILFIITTALAGLAIAVVKALAKVQTASGAEAGSPWGTFTIAMSIPAALIVGLYLHKIRPGRTAEASVIGVSIVLAGVVLGHFVQNSAWGQVFSLSETQLKLILPIYGFIASVLPVWVLLCPRDYLSSYLKIGTITLLAVGIFLVHPQLRMPAFTPFVSGGGPVISGAVWPFVCIIIMCGAISGFHSLIGSGTTPKMINRESDIRFIGFGAMLVEGFVAIMALVAATSLAPGDYFAINAAPAKLKALAPAVVAHFPEVQQPERLGELTRMVGEKTLEGRTGGAVSLAVGMASIFAAIPGLKGLMSYWYHFAIMFEALFILTAVDTGTRVARFIVQEMVAPLWRPKRAAGQWASTVFTSAVACFAWGYLLYKGSIDTIWPMFGVANQLLAGLALGIGTTLILRSRKPSYALTTFIPMVYVLATTVVAGIQNIQSYRQSSLLKPELAGDNLLRIILTGVMLFLVGYITVEAVGAWVGILRGRARAAVEEPMPIPAHAEAEVEA